MEDADPDHPLIRTLVTDLAGQLTAGVVLLNVQPEPDEVRTRAIFKDKTRALLLERGNKVLAPARQALATAGIMHASHVLICDDVEEIVRHAHQESCSLIVVAAGPQGEWRRHWLGITGQTSKSIASRLADVADIPLLVIRRRGL